MRYDSYLDVVKSQRCRACNIQVCTRCFQLFRVGEQLTTALLDTLDGDASDRELVSNISETKPASRDGTR